MSEPCTPEWLQAQVAEYDRLQERYGRLAAVLERILGSAARRHAPTAIVQTRAKQISSFAEKCLRKCHKYRMPAHQLTDLCGARLIARTAPEVRAVSRLLEEDLDVDWENSDDASHRLSWSEFGYRSIHYVVSLRPDADGGSGDDDLLGFTCEHEGCPGRGTFHPLKAEIQVRTLAEHAWADVAHDLTYKGAFELPPGWRREIALMAADLEDVDRTVERIEEGLRTYAASYGSYLAPDEVAAEIDTLEMVLGFDPDNAALAQRIGKLAMTAGDWDRAVAVMEPFVDPEHPERAHQPLLRDLGVALGKRRASPDDLLRARRNLEAAVELEPSDSDAIASLAGTWRGEDDDRARVLYRHAFEADPSDYYPLLNYVDFEIERSGGTGILEILDPMSRRAVERCRAHISVGVNLPWALFSMAKFRLLLGFPYEALDWYSLAIRATNSLFAVPGLDRGTAADEIEGYEWARRLLLLARGARFGDPAAAEQLRALATPGAEPLRGPLLIVAGGTDPRFARQIEGFRTILDAVLSGFEGTVISGGTHQGICGMVGELGAAAGDRLRTVGYLPAELPADAEPDPSYDELRRTPGSEFTPLEPLQNWIDITAAGIDPAQVTVIGINGGRIAAAELRIALALGARVGVVEGSGRESARLLADERWGAIDNLASLPMDPQTVRAYAAPMRAGDHPIDREALAKELHRIYREEVARAQQDDPARAEWADLPEDLKASNLAQVDAIVAKLDAVGCALRYTEGDPAPFSFAEDEVEHLAEMEHGRWNAERLAAGWRWGPDRDAEAKRSPYLVPWAELPEEIREYDRAFVRRIPDLLADAGLEIVRGE